MNFNLFSQECGFHDATEKSHKQSKDVIIYNEDSYRNLTQNRNLGGPYTIPVVWHVVKDNSNNGEVLDQTINDYMTYLNNKFNAMLGGTPQSPIITFKLARIDPNGYCTSGIVRYNSAQPYGSDQGGWDNLLKSSRRWPVDKYLNIYTVYDMVTASQTPTPNPSLLGYAPAICNPTSPSSIFSMSCLTPGGGNSTFNIEDGAVIRYNNFSGLFHEVGHWAGLFHTWGPEGNNSSTPWWTQCGTGNQNGDFVGATNQMTPTSESSNCTSTKTCDTGSGDPADPLSNLMSYSIGCWPSITSSDGFQSGPDGQGDRVKLILDNNRTFIHSTANNLATGMNNFIENSNITTNTTWTTANLPNGGNVRSGSITIAAGATLTISSGVFITMCRNSTIFINAGGKLIVNGATITADSPGWWNGIEVQSSSSQATVTECRVNVASVIKNAIIGVKCYNYGFLPGYPGKVFTNGASFIDNFTAISLTSQVERNFGDNQILNTTFTNNLTTGFLKFIELLRVTTFTVKGSTFTNNVTSSTLALNGTGIHSISSGLSTCIEYPASSDCGLNTFSGFADAILIETPGTQKFNKIVNNTFNNSVFDIRVLSTNTGKITHNTFNLLNSPISSSDRFGVHITVANTAMSIQENNFTSSQLNPLAPFRVGVFHDGTGNVTKYVRKNTFTRMSHGVKAVNANAINTVTITGLTYTCNFFNPNGSGAMSVRDIFPQAGANTVSKNQKGIFIDPTNGPQDRATGNTFFNSGGLYRSIENLMTPVMNYQLRDSAMFPQEKPLFSINISKIIKTATACAVEECWTCPPQIVNQISSNRGGIEEWQSQLNMLLENRAKLFDEYQMHKDKWNDKEIEDYSNKSSNNEIAIDILGSKLISYYLSKSDEDHTKEIYTLIKNINKYSSQLWLLKEYCSFQQWDEADRLISDIMRSEHYVDYEDFMTVLNLFDVIKRQEVISKDDVAKIKVIADTYLGNGAAWAQSIMSTYGVIYYPKQEVQEEKQLIEPKVEMRTIKQNDIVIFPNPAENNLNISVNESNKSRVIYITSLTGKKLVVKNAEVGNNIIDISQLYKGVYIITLKELDLSVFISKFIKI